MVSDIELHPKVGVVVKQQEQQQRQQPALVAAVKSLAGYETGAMQSSSQGLMAGTVLI